jgi:hypothetical protein
MVSSPAKSPSVIILIIPSPGLLLQITTAIAPASWAYQTLSLKEHAPRRTNATLPAMSRPFTTESQPLTAMSSTGPPTVSDSTQTRLPVTDSPGERIPPKSGLGYPTPSVPAMLPGELIVNCRPSCADREVARTRKTKVESSVNNCFILKFSFDE